MVEPVSVLLLEDRESDALLIIETLREYGLDVRWEWVENEQDYLSRLGDAPDVILADFTLPGYDAMRALDALRERQLDIPFIVVTGTIDEEAAVACLKRGADDFLHKDRLARLASAISHALEEKRLRTEKRRADDDLRETNARLQATLEELRATQAVALMHERLRALGEMAGGLAHDFNNALGPVLGFTDLLLSEPETLEHHDVVRHYLELVRTCAQDATQVVRRLREFYRPPDDDPDLIPIDMAKLLQEAALLTRPRWHDQSLMEGCVIEVRVDAPPDTLVRGAPSELRESITNLIFNAVDAMPSGGRITLAARRRDGEVAIEVSDTGIGMDDAVRARCTEMFFTTKGRRGTGLGLAMVGGIVRRHGGRLEVSSEVGRGSTFRILLPEAAPSPCSAVQPTLVPSLQAIEAGPCRRSADARAHGAETVLVVDDDERMRAVIEQYLRGDDYRVDVTASHHEALAMLGRKRYDAVITDRAMAGRRGDELAAMAKQQSPGVPVIMLTGFGDFMQSTADRPAGVDLVLGKPVRREVLCSALARLLESRRRGADERATPLLPVMPTGQGT